MHVSFPGGPDCSLTSRAPQHERTVQDGYGRAGVKVCSLLGKSRIFVDTISTHESPVECQHAP